MTRAAELALDFQAGRIPNAAPMHEEKVHVRLLIVAGVALLWMTAIFRGGLGYLQLVRHSEYLVRAQRQQQRTIEITPKRGAIYDRNMHPRR